MRIAVILIVLVAGVLVGSAIATDPWWTYAGTYNDPPTLLSKAALAAFAAATWAVCLAAERQT